MIYFIIIQKCTFTALIRKYSEKYSFIYPAPVFCYYVSINSIPKYSRFLYVSAWDQLKFPLNFSNESNLAVSAGVVPKKLIQSQTVSTSNSQHIRAQSTPSLSHIVKESTSSLGRSEASKWRLTREALSCSLSAGLRRKVSDRGGGWMEHGEECLST
ncbi:hypothetical protein AVEN_36073-1 [Araneus ventricosus]|uniref:Uncharacterized protein n=1 Tax=Araneus ventricosus TaxID=182803 RepID=A0A4Y2S9R4_ARAVE|nr:hypothetical protein AVEN_36073-1 [Araneus ventricosus]